MGNPASLTNLTYYLADELHPTEVGQDLVVDVYERNLNAYFQGVPVPIFGAIAKTEAGDTVSATGGSALTGSAAITEAGDTVSSASKLAIQGAAAITEAGDTLSASGDSGRTAAAAITEADDTSAATATLALRAALSVIEGNDTLSAAGTGPIVATPFSRVRSSGTQIRPFVRPETRAFSRPSIRDRR
jgi:hypothetical protein